MLELEDIYKQIRHYLYIIVADLARMTQMISSAQHISQMIS